jgi:hypothetical protein
VPGDTWPSNQVEQTNTCALEELSENIDAESGKPGPVLVDTGEKKVQKRRIEGVLYYTTGLSALCMGAVMIDPNRIVEGVALTVLGLSFGFAKFLVAGKEKKP